MAQNINKYINISVITPKTTLFNGQAESLSSTNSEGRFDVLPEHANFITIIENQPIEIILPNKQKIDFKFSQAIIYNYKNNVAIFAEPFGK